MPKPLITESKRIGNLVITSGITAPPGDVATQARSIFEKIKKILEKQGTSMKHVLKANVYLADIGDREPKFNGIWREYFPDNPPARTTVQVGLGPGTLVEVEVVAEIPEK